MLKLSWISGRIEPDAKNRRDSHPCDLDLFDDRLLLAAAGAGLVDPLQLACALCGELDDVRVQIALAVAANIPCAP